VINRRVPIASPRYVFVSETISGAPDDPGVYALYSHDELLYYGHALGSATILTRLMAHRLKLIEPSEATHYAWEICREPQARVVELVREYERRFRRPPRYNLGQSSV
jgi:hypothetical protein